MTTSPFIERVRVRNFKSVATCQVSLGRLTLLVGRNGSGKSNFLDALRFIADALQTSLDHAVKSRGGIDEVRRRSTGHPHNFEIEVLLNLTDRRMALYGFEVAAQPKGGFAVKREWLKNARNQTYFEVRDGQAAGSLEHLPPAAKDRLYLVTAAGLPEFRETYDALASMGFYNLNPQQMKEIQSPDAVELLRRDGSNLASVVARLSEDRPETKLRIKDFLSAIVPDIVDFERIQLGPRETLQFRQQVRGSEHPWRFFASSMSDGTLRVLGVLTAVMQLVDRKRSVRLVGIEEPETALHPAAAAALMDALREAAQHTQVLVTTHSPDLVNQIRLEEEELLVVHKNQGETQIGKADPASVEAIRSHLYSAGDLFRMDQLQPEIDSSSDKQLDFLACEGSA